MRVRVLSSRHLHTLRSYNSNSKSLGKINVRRGDSEDSNTYSYMMCIGSDGVSSSIFTGITLTPSMDRSGALISLVPRKSKIFIIPKVRSCSFPLSVILEGSEARK